MATYPNMYILLVGPPASGKGIARKHAVQCMRRLPNVHLAPSNITQASFYKKIEAAMSHSPGKQGVLEGIHHSLTAMVDELTVFVRRGDIPFMDVLTDAFDCPNPLDKSTAHVGEQNIENSFFNLLGCTTPRSLAEVFTPEALEQGLPSRCIIVYSDKQPVQGAELFPAQDEAAARLERKEQKLRALTEDLQEINELHGQFLLTSDAREAIQSWWDQGLEPAPDDPKLAYYCDRRLIHFMKLCMAVSASCSSDMLIEYEHYKYAREMFLEVERAMLRATSALGGNYHYQAMRDIIKFVIREHLRTSRPVPEFKVRQILNKDIPVNMIDYLLMGIVRDHQLEVLGSGLKTEFVPGKISKSIARDLEAEDLNLKGLKVQD